MEGGSSDNELLISVILAVKQRKNECGINGGQDTKEGQNAFYPCQNKTFLSKILSAYAQQLMTFSHTTIFSYFPPSNFQGLTSRKSCLGRRVCLKTRLVFHYHQCLSQTGSKLKQIFLDTIVLGVQGDYRGLRKLLPLYFSDRLFRPIRTHGLATLNTTLYYRENLR